MSRYAYVNGRMSRLAEACVHIEDRGFQFADGVYEVWAVFGGKLADAEGHFVRLERSLSELRIAMPMSRAALTVVLREVIRRNRVAEGIVYLQVTRGAARRDHAFPHPATVPSVILTARRLDFAAAGLKAAEGVAVITQPDTRWGRCDIKTVGLLPNALAKQAAKEAGAYEAWFVDTDGYVTEGASTNAWIVDRDGVIRTRSTEANILRGVTRTTLFGVAEAAGYRISEVPFTVEEAKAAREAFLTAASSLVVPIISIDGAPVGNGHPGEVATTLRDHYIAAARASAI
jgi:D-alanine transaminase